MEIITLLHFDSCFSKHIIIKPVYEVERVGNQEIY